MRQEFSTTDVLRLEVEGTVSGIRNLIQNPSGELGTFGWITPTPGGSLTTDGWSLTYHPDGLTGTSDEWYSESYGAIAGQYVAVSWDAYNPGGSYTSNLQFLDASNNVVSSTTNTSFSSGGWATKNAGPAQVPSGASKVRLRFSVPTGTHTVSFRRAMLATSANPADLGTHRENRVPNPSFESSAAGWTAASGTIERSTAVGGAHGSAALRITYGQATTICLVDENVTYAVQAQFRSASATRATAYTITWQSVTGAHLGTTSGTFQQVGSVAGTWTRNSVVRTAPAGAKKMILTVGAVGQAVNEVHYIDAVMVEPSGSVNDYFDGSFSDTADLNYEFVSGDVLVTTRSNLIANPSFEVNTSGWSSKSKTTISRVSTYSTDGSYSLRMVTPSGATPGVYSPRAVIQGGVTYTATANLMGSTGGYANTDTKTISIRWYTTAGVLISSSSSSNVNGEGLRVTGKAPSNATRASVMVAADDDGTWYVDSVRLAEASEAETYFDGSFASSVIDYGTISYSWADTAHNSTSIETTSITLPYSLVTSSKLSYAEPVPFADVLGPSHQITVTREALNTGTLTATIIDSTLDPSQSAIIRPGRLVRLLALSGGSYEAIFTGRLYEANVTYTLGDPNIPESRRARIEMVATDNAATLANVSRPEGVGTIDELPYVLEGASVPFNVNGSGNQVADVDVVSFNQNATALDQVAITRDSNLGYAWIDKENVLQVWDADQPFNGGPYTMDEAVYSDIDIAFSTNDCINEVRVKSLEPDPRSSAQTVEVTYGPFRDQSSVDEWGAFSSEFTVQGLDESQIAELGAAVLAANSTPKVRVNSLLIPIKEASDITAGKALLELYSRASVSNAEKSINQTLWVNSITHTITPDKWMMSVAFAGEGTVALPRATPSVPEAQSDQDINVKGYGAGGDGVANDAPAFVKAIADAEAQGGGRIRIPRGTYSIGVVDVPSNVTLEGDGRDVTIIQGGFRGINVRSVGIKHMSLVGDGTGRGLEFGYEGDAPDVWEPGLPTVPYYLDISHIEVRNFEYGLYMQTPIVSHFNNVIAVENAWGFFFPEAGTSCTFTSCWARSNTHCGFFFHWTVYFSLNGCAADFNGVSYYLHQGQATVFNGCGSEKTSINSVSYNDYGPFGTAAGQQLFNEANRGASWVFDGCNTSLVQSCIAINTNGIGVHIENGTMVGGAKAGTAWENRIAGFAANNEEIYTGGQVKTEAQTSSTLVDVRAVLDVANDTAVILNDGGGSMNIRRDIRVGRDLVVEGDIYTEGELTVEEASRFVGAIYLGPGGQFDTNFYQVAGRIRTDAKFIAGNGIGTGDWEWATGVLPGAPSRRIPLYGPDGDRLGYFPLYGDAF